MMGRLTDEFTPKADELAIAQDHVELLMQKRSELQKLSDALGEAEQQTKAASAESELKHLVEYVERLHDNGRELLRPIYPNKER